MVITVAITCSLLATRADAVLQATNSALTNHARFWFRLSPPLRWSIRVGRLCVESDLHLFHREVQYFGLCFVGFVDLSMASVKCDLLRAGVTGTASDVYVRPSGIGAQSDTMACIWMRVSWFSCSSFCSRVPPAFTRFVSSETCDDRACTCVHVFASMMSLPFREDFVTRSTSAVSRVFSFLR